MNKTNSMDVEYCTTLQGAILKGTSLMERKMEEAERLDSPVIQCVENSRTTCRMDLVCSSFQTEIRMKATGT